LFRRFLAWPLVAVVGFCGGDVRGAAAQTRFALADAGVTSTETIPQAVGREIEAGLFPGVVLLVGRPGRVLYHEAFGYARIVPEKVPMQKDSIFDLASVTKVVATATAFGVCVDDGSLRFGMPIRQGLPDLSGSGIDPITVDQLATHTSGFDNTKYHGQARGEAMLEQMLHASPQWEPGSRYFYSCLNMILLGRMVEGRAGNGWMRSANRGSSARWGCATRLSARCVLGREWFPAGLRRLARSRTSRHVSRAGRWATRACSAPPATWPASAK